MTKPFASTKNVNIYSFNSPSAHSGKVFAAVNIYDNEKVFKRTGQSGWTVLNTKKKVLRELNNAILNAINNHLVKRGESPEAFYRGNKDYTDNSILLDKMTEEYGITVKLLGYKILYAVSKDNSLKLNKKRTQISEYRDKRLLQKTKYDKVKKSDIKQSFSEQTNVELETEKTFKQKELRDNIKEIYENRKSSIDK